MKAKKVVRITRTTQNGPNRGLFCFFHDLLEHGIDLANLNLRGVLFGGHARTFLACNFGLEIGDGCVPLYATLWTSRTAVCGVSVCPTGATCALAARAANAGPGNPIDLFLLHRKADAFLTNINGYDANLDDVAYGQGFLCVLNELVAYFGYVYKSVLMDTDIDECSEVCNVRYDTFHPAAGNQVLDGLDAVVKLCVAEFLARVAAWLL